jgi:hypothetical protein
MNAVLSDARRGHQGLFWFAAAMAGLAAVLAVLAVVDSGTVLGANQWFKPLKFAVSFTAYAGALAWMLGQLPARALRATGWIYLATIAVALRFLREPGRDRASGLAIRLGLLIGLVGLGVGGIMVAFGSHAVGVADGGPGLPFVGWSTTGGDLRIAHFVGMHALQLLPLLAAALAAFGDRLDPPARARIVAVTAAGYVGFVVLITWQALRAQPLLAPDGLTLAAFAAIALGTVAGLLGALRPRRITA